MYLKMQESGLTEVIHLICILTIWSQYPVSLFWIPLTAQGDRGWWLDRGQYSLFTDMEGKSSNSKLNVPIYQKVLEIKYHGAILISFFFF